MKLPSKEDIYAMLRPFSDIDRKVVGGLIALWVSDPAKVKDKEWTTGQFVQLATVAHGFDEEDGPATSEHVEQIEAYAKESMEKIVRACFALFVRLALDMQDKQEGFTFEHTQECLRVYLENSTAPDK